MVASNRKRGTPTKRGAPAKTVEARENQLINLAVSLAEEQLSNGSASSQVITHFLKLGTTIASLEKEKLVQENLLLAARTDALQSVKEIEALYKDALKAMRSYGGQDNSGADADD